MKGRLTEDFRGSFAIELSIILGKHLPWLNPSRGKYVKDLPKDKQVGRYVRVLRIVSEEIFPGDKQISTHLIGDITRY